VLCIQWNISLSTFTITTNDIGVCGKMSLIKRVKPQKESYREILEGGRQKLGVGHNGEEF